MVLLKEVREGIWGLTVGSNSTSDVATENPFRLTMAALEVDDGNDTAGSGITRVTIKSNTADKGPQTDLILCNLRYPSCLQQPLDIEFYEGQTLTFGVKGPHKVHLTGYILQAEPQEMCEEGHMHGGKHHGMFETVGNTDSEDDDDDDDDDEDDDDDDDEDSADDNALLHAPRRKLRDDEDQDLEGDYEDGFVQGEDQISAETSSSSESEDDAEQKASALAAKGKKRVRSESNGHGKKQEPQTKKNKNVKEEPSTTVEAESKKAKKPAKKETASANDTSAATSTTADVKKKTTSLEMKDLRVGNGPEAKLGKTVAVYYSGRLQSNNKMFDSCTSGKPFRFRLGAGEVIRGWDQGVKGMRVGGKRRLTIPPSLAYGSQKLPDIPANSTLVFDVEVKNVF